MEGLPCCPTDMSEPEYADLIFCSYCQVWLLLPILRLSCAKKSSDGLATALFAAEWHSYLYHMSASSMPFMRLCKVAYAFIAIVDVRTSMILFHDSSRPVLLGHTDDGWTLGTVFPHLDFDPDTAAADMTTILPHFNIRVHKATGEYVCKVRAYQAMLKLDLQSPRGPVAGHGQWRFRPANMNTSRRP